MSFVANQSSPLQKTGIFSRALIPNSNSVAGGLVVVFVSSADRDQIDIPTSASALLNGRAYAGVVDADQQTVDTTKDLTVLVQCDGIQPCQLKANTACTSGQAAAYDPADGGLVVPWTSAAQVCIGKFIDERSSSASIQWVGVQLDPAASAGLESGLVMFAQPQAGTPSTTSEVTYTNASYSIPANFSRVGDKYEFEYVFDVSNQNGSDTLVVAWKIGSTVIAQTVSTYNPATGDDIIIRGSVHFTSIGATATPAFAGTVIYGAAAAPGVAVPGISFASVDTTGALAITVSAQWSASSANNVVDLKAGSGFLSRKSA